MAKTRFKIPDLPDFFFEVEDQKGRGSQLTIDNISASGIGLHQNDSYNHLPMIGETIKGKLIKGATTIDTEAKIVHKTNNIIGCQFTDSLAKIDKFIGDELLKDLFPSLKA